MLKNNFFTLIIVALVLVAASVYVYGNNFRNFLNSGVLTTPTLSPNAKTEEFIITGSNFKFNPNQLTVTKGDKIKITFKDSDGPHNLTIPDFHTSTKTLSAGQQEIIEFIADKTGSFPFYCSYSHHKEFGMMGKITVK